MDEHNITKIDVKTKDHGIKNISNVTAITNISPTTFSSVLTKKWHIESLDNSNSEGNLLIKNYLFE